jgi:hypothetical protein
MPRGGARPGSGPKKKKLAAPELEAQREKQRHSGYLYRTIVAQTAPTPDEIATGKRQAEPYEITLWRTKIEGDSGLLWKLFEHWQGRAVNTINHLHDKPLEMNVNLSISERMRVALEKAKERVSRIG